MARVLTLGDAAQQSGGWLLDKWNAALAKYQADKTAWLNWYTNNQTFALQSPQVREEADALYAKIRAFETAIEKIGALLQQGSGSWEQIKEYMQQHFPTFDGIRGWLGLSGMGAAVPLALPFAGATVIAGALAWMKWLDYRIVQQNSVVNQATTLCDRLKAENPQAECGEILRRAGQQIGDSTPGISVAGVKVPYWGIGAGVLLALYLLRSR